MSDRPSIEHLNRARAASEVLSLAIELVDVDGWPEGKRHFSEVLMDLHRAVDRLGAQR